MNIFEENIKDHYRNPRNYSSKQIEYNGSCQNLSCGDEIFVLLDVGYSKINILESRVISCIFTGSGCAISIATMSMLSDEVIGKTLGEIDAWDENYLKTLIEIDINPARKKCLIIGLEALKQAISNLTR